MRPTAAALRRFPRAAGGLARKGGPLPAKFGNRLWYKGNRARSLGRHTTKGAYHVNYARRVPQYVVPGAAESVFAGGAHPVAPAVPLAARVGADGWDHGLKPYVSARTPKIVVPPPPMPAGFRELLGREDRPR
jgi:Mitochondrial ribosomal protein L27